MSSVATKEISVVQNQLDVAPFLELIFADAVSSERQLSIFTLPGQTTRRFNSIHSAVEYTENQAGAKDVYFGLGLVSGNPNGRGVLENMAAIGCLWADIDIAGPGHKGKNYPSDMAAARELLSRLPLSPSIVVRSGGGLHAYWVFKEPWIFEGPQNRAAAERFSKGWGGTILNEARAKGYTLDSVADLTRIFRLPGTLNHKHTPPALVEVIEVNSFRYNPDDFELYLADDDTPPAGQGGEIAEVELRFDAEPPADKLARLSSKYPKFKATWERKRTDLKSPSEYDLALADFAVIAGWTDQEVANLLIAWRRLHCKEPEKALRRDYIERTIGKARNLQQQAPQREPPAEPETDGYRLTDYGNAERFVAQHGWSVHWGAKWRAWLVWTGKRWERDSGGETERMAKATVRQMKKTAEDDGDDKLAVWAKASESNRRIRDMLELAKSEPGIAITPDKLDEDPWLLNCLNGTIDLRNGKLRPHCRDDLITKLCPVEYHPEAKSEDWDKFLLAATSGNQEMLDFMQRAVGYTLTGLTTQEVLFFVIGLAATGKSTFMEALKAMLGDYAKTADFETFLKRSQVGGARNDIARLEGARFVASIEVDEGKRLAEGLVKAITGGDTIAARYLYSETTEYVPQFKLWLCANHAPHVKSYDDGMWRRILRIPFDHVVPPERRDPDLKSRLRDTAKCGPAVLAWAVDGCLAWQKTGLGVPQAVTEATEEYQRSMDPLKDFFDDLCEFGGHATHSVLVKTLRETYGRWCEANGIKRPVGQQTFNNRLKTEGCLQERIATKSGQRPREWRGISLKASEQISEPPY